MEKILMRTSDFDEIIEKGLRMVDKTHFIKDFMTYGNEVCKILRPQGFGKSTNLSMLKSFLSIGADPSKFAHFDIGRPEHQSFVEEHCGKYPVVYLKFNDIKGETWKEMSRELIKSIKSLLYSHLHELPENDPWNLKSSKSDSKDIEDFTRVLEELTQMLREKHKSKVIVLIDDYDVPLNEAYRKGYYEHAATFFQSFYIRGLNNNANLKKACLMGIVEIRSVGSFCSSYYATVYSIADKNFSTRFGFNTFEIWQYLRDVNFERKSDMEAYVREWYNGYNIGNVLEVANSWSFISWYETKVYQKYWIDTSFSDTIKTLLQMCIPTGNDIISKLLRGEKVILDTPCAALKYYVEISGINSLLHLLVLTGYLTFQRLPPSNGDYWGSIKVYIPNKELSLHWKDEIIKSYNTTDCDEIRSDVYGAITRNPFNIGTLEQTLKKYFVTGFSSYDFRDENSYQVALVSFFSSIFFGDDCFTVSSNREEGYGGYGILIKIRYMIKRVLCFVLKHAKQAKFLQQNAQEAFEQVTTNDYTIEYDNYKRILIGVAFSKNSMSKLVMGPSDLEPVATHAGEEPDLEPTAVEPVVGPILRKRASSQKTVTKTKKKPRK